MRIVPLYTYACIHTYTYACIHTCQVVKELTIQIEAHKKQIKKLEEMLGPDFKMFEQMERVEGRVKQKEISLKK